MSAEFWLYSVHAKESIKKNCLYSTQLIIMYSILWFLSIISPVTWAVLRKILFNDNNFTQSKLLGPYPFLVTIVTYVILLYLIRRCAISWYLVEQLSARIDTYSWLRQVPFFVILAWKHSYTSQKVVHAR
ncbi:hypothetical protein PHYBLDRAFT_58935 [Phycomyces blakesleeanus NRRL 1555(-)]|uniref:Uncharacterized protein n=1 Tax=Phycomyces blakesleeanus (strain ATCC 8743b / DSM 1359 / FGSC 10004 / NBRC 33097 / NRRL 1555) TaxID=763407 RepID=A0A167QLR0_PHYB8|nr:hypothetical protein PHYBLDRAFT_58935 [Phycomyces blakesleeanus NRRL 1555(-)]OAD79891.1 hypothetical protein PHYBLDRAFT_58935 [Phycomyces blakesleeanus NRRL 1555(-)]|eukprot:XP_018297931.1 hypothetical protein PHYBLDRAFT_58935 [Phycomyces blakesleeanus NRRL 1555(-)]